MIDWLIDINSPRVGKIRIRASPYCWLRTFERESFTVWTLYSVALTLAGKITDEFMKVMQLIRHLPFICVIDWCSFPILNTAAFCFSAWICLLTFLIYLCSWTSHISCNFDSMALRITMQWFPMRAVSSILQSLRTIFLLDFSAFHTPITLLLPVGTLCIWIMNFMHLQLVQNVNFWLLKLIVWYTCMF